MSENLNRDKILSMPAGIDIDILVAERILGWRWYANHEKIMRWIGKPDCRAELADLSLPIGILSVMEYSLDINVAWYVVEKLKEDGWDVSIAWEDNLWSCDFIKNHGEKWYGTTSSTAPLAICLASLLTTIDEVKDE